MIPEVDVTDIPALKAKARHARKAFESSPLSRFVRKMKEVISDYLTAREQGVSREDACRGIEEVLRAEWPQKPTKFPPCVGCDDTGWRLMDCTHDMRCGRELCGEKHPAWEHTYVVPCDCAKGDKFRPKPWQPADELADAAKVKKRKSAGWSRFGG